MTPVMISVPAKELRDGDFLEGRGVASTIGTTHDGKVCARVGKHLFLYGPDELVRVRLEDDGREA